MQEEYHDAACTILKNTHINKKGECLKIADPSSGTFQMATKMLSIEVTETDGDCASYALAGNTAFTNTSVGMMDAIQLFIGKVLFMGMWDPTPAGLYGCAALPAAA